MKLVEIAGDPIVTLEQYVQEKSRKVGWNLVSIRPAADNVMSIRSFGNCSNMSLAMLDMSNQLISSLEGCPSEVSVEICFYGCSPLKSLHNIHKHVKSTAKISFNHGVTHLLGLLLIPDLKRIRIWGGIHAEKPGLETLINDHLNAEERDIHDFQEALMKAGFKDEARL